MKVRYDNLYEKITSQDNLTDAFYKTQAASNKFKTGSLIFEENITKNLINLRQELVEQSYLPGNYHSFYVYEPKQRLIYAPVFRDKIVHHAINNILKDIYINSFIPTTFACIEGRGVYSALKQLKHYVSTSRDSDWVVKLDMKQFFYSINHNSLKRVLRKKIKCQKTLNLLDRVIDSSPINPGLPLGNLTSQIFANIYMNEVDQYCKRQLGLKKYIRYMDDIIIIVPTKIKAAQTIKSVARLILSLNLLLNKKSKIFPITQGINSLGVKISKNYCLLRKSSIDTIKKIIKLKNVLSVSKFEQRVNSWKGHAVNANISNFIEVYNDLLSIK